MDRDRLSQLVTLINQALRPNLGLKSIRPHDPVQVTDLPSPWRLLGTGNYAAVFTHPDYPDQAIKIYAPNRPGFEEEVEVYRRLGDHPAFSCCFYAESGMLILRRLRGITLFNCLHQRRRMPVQVIADIDRALADAITRGLSPRDIHGKNVMMHEGRGFVVDISDFLRPGMGSAWGDFKLFYYWIYRPLLSPARVPVPLILLEASRVSYRWLRRLLRRIA